MPKCFGKSGEKLGTETAKTWLVALSGYFSMVILHLTMREMLINISP